MLILAIDTSTRTGSVALLRDDLVIDSVSGYEETPHSTRLFRDLELLQNRAQFRLYQIDVFAVAAGPGSFTGLRVGLTAVKAWAEIHDKPIAAISGLEAIAAQSKSLIGESRGAGIVVAPFLDARRGQLFGSLYHSKQGNPRRATLELISDESILTAEEFVDLVGGESDFATCTLVSPTPEILPVSLIDSRLPGVHIETVSAVLAPMIGQLGFERATRGELVDALRLDANYVRRSDAEKAWKDAG
ncbi:MAG: tRNA (adenosine(37)-N6)-threonylcarbamoyltransferase complex dimerization subunit type 1 TsaB [Candidatus Acidiferrales bacterium]|jgi:tRNA threonylcarbamoyladenosine biosynthesis protein TsaB